METPTAKRCAKVRRFSGNANLIWENVGRNRTFKVKAFS
jgi:hypothetical protein